MRFNVLYYNNNLKHINNARKLFTINIVITNIRFFAKCKQFQNL